MGWLKTSASLLVVLCACVSLLPGQTSFGSVNGTVTDQTGARIPGASVTLINQQTNIETEAITNDSGYFVVVNVRPATYRLRVELPGFKTAQVAPLVVGVNQAVTQNLTLEVGEVTETVEVFSRSELIQASSSELGNVVEEEVIRSIPLNGRNFTQQIWTAVM